MRIAVLLDEICLSQIRKDIKIGFLFEMDETVVTAVDREMINVNDIQYICLWMLGKQVKTVYYDYFTEPEKELIGKAGIGIRPLNEIRNNPIFRAMLIYP